MMKNKVLTLMILNLALLGKAQTNAELEKFLICQKRLFSFIKADEAMNLISGSHEVKIGIIDSGFDFFHPNLKQVLVPVYFADNAYHTEVSDNISHGTLVAGLIGANSSNNNGISGLVPNCKILTASTGTIVNPMLKIKNDLKAIKPDFTLADLQKEMQKNSSVLADFSNKWISFQARAFYESVKSLVDNGVKVINYSAFTENSDRLSPETRTLFQNGFEYAFQNNVIIVIGSGNSDREVKAYFGHPENTIVVGASTFDNERWSESTSYKGQMIRQGSSYGDGLTLVAPADSLAICVPSDPRYYTANDSPDGQVDDHYHGPYTLMPHGATSSATAITTALVALIISAHPELDCRSVIQHIKEGCDDIGQEGFDKFTGYGRINFLKTLENINHDK